MVTGRSLLGFAEGDSRFCAINKLWFCLATTGSSWCCCVGRRRAPLAGEMRRTVVKDGTDFEYSLGSYRRRLLECPRSSTEAVDPGDDFDEYVECAIRVACSDGGRPWASGVAGIGESGT